LQEEPRRWRAWIFVAAVLVAVAAGAAVYYQESLFQTAVEEEQASGADEATLGETAPNEALARPSPMPPPEAPPVVQEQPVETATAAPEPAPPEPPARPDPPPLPDFSAGEPSLVEIRVQPNGARIEIDRGARTCQSPCSILLDPGRHVLNATLQGYRPALRAIEVPKETEVNLVLERASGTLMIRTNPAGASIVVDGQTRTQRTPAVLTLPVGQHRLQLQLEGRTPYEEVIDVKDQVTTTIGVNW
jgi:hypothetical protein